MTTVTAKRKEPEEGSPPKRVEKRRSNPAALPAVKMLGKPPYSVNGAISGSTGYVRI